MIKIMKINTLKDLKSLLEYCKAIPHSEPYEGGKFYKIKSQNFKFPDNQVQTREYIDKKPSSIIVPITKGGNVVFVVQPIALSEEGSLLEFPAGYWELGENGIEAGIRELSEETGYVPEKIIPLGSHYQDPGSIKQKVNCYLGLGCEKLNKQQLDKGEFIKYIEVPYNFAIELMDEGYLKDANSYISLTKSDRFIQKELIKENSNNQRKI